MANEIKFIFSGDTAAFDKAIDSVVKKTNKAKASTEGITDAQKTQAKLQKLLNEEYEQGAKTTGGLLKIQKEIKRVEEQRVKIEKRLANSSLKRKNRLRDIVALSRTEARLAGLAAARRNVVKGAAVRAGSSVLTGVGLGAVARVGAGAAAAAGMAALTGPVGWAIAALVAAVAVIVISLKIFKSAIKATAAAMNKAMGLQKTAQIAGKTVEQVQAEQMAGMFGGDAEKDFDLFKELGLIIDKELIASLTRSGKTLMAFGIQVANVLIPIFEKLAKVTAGLVKILGGSVLALKATFEPVFAWIADNKIKSMVPAVLAYGIATNMDPAAGIDAFWDYIKKMNKLVRGEFEGAAAGAAAGIAMQTPSDALTRIGLFKGGADSQLQTLKASLAAQRGTELNTTGLISAVTNA